MRLISIKMCQPGMTLAKNIYNEAGLVLLGANYELTANSIRRLESLGIDFVYIHDARTDDIQVKELISDETRIRALTEIRSTFRRTIELSNRKMVSYPQIGKNFRNLIAMILDDLSANADMMIMLVNMNAVDNYLYQHSLNVCLYTSMLGIAHGYEREDLYTLGLGAILHDIGKTQISYEVLTKPGPLTEEEYEHMKTHAELGFRQLKDEPNIPLLSAHCALQHHERLDGSGYPRGLVEADIHDFAKWVGLVDSYDAMTTHRTYRSAMLPHQALEILYTGSGNLYDQKMIEYFRNIVAIYPLGVTVTLNTGESGVVVDLNASFPQRPIVRILQDADGQNISQPYEVDLSKKLTLLITGVNDVKITQHT